MTRLESNPDVLIDTAKVILKKIDPPKRKKDIPAPPIISEFFGLHKSGKDTQLVELDRWFKRQKFRVLIRQESAESEPIRTMTRDNPYAYEMRHFAYTFANLLDASGSRDFHLVILNRGIIDTLCWLEKLRRKGEITDKQNSIAKEFVLNGPWLDCVDAFFYLTCDIETALQREYANSTGEINYGSRMNPDELKLINDCLESVYAELKNRFPDLPIFRIDTTNRPIAEVRDEILALLLGSVTKRLSLREDDLLPWSKTMLRQKAWMAGPELKFRKTVSHEKLRKNGWQLIGAVTEEDTYLTPRNKQFLDGNECFHVRRSGDTTYFIYKKEGVDSRHWSKIHVPIPEDCVGDILAAFDKVIDVKKRREIFMKQGFVLHRDRVDGLGDFTEIKSTTPTDDSVLFDMALELGLNSEDTFPESYVKLMMRIKPDND